MQNSVAYLRLFPAWRTVILFFFSLILMHTSTTSSIASANVNHTQKPMWYRYYDKNGIANISSNVTPAHVRHGYEALDRNMQVIKRSRPYSTEQDLKQSSQRAATYKRNEEDVRLKRAYGSSQMAITKKNEALLNIKKQIQTQSDQLIQLEKDRILFQKQARAYHGKSNAMPKQLKDNLNNNAANIQFFKKNITSLQMHYRNKQENYDTIIKRLKQLE